MANMANMANLESKLSMEIKNLARGNLVSELSSDSTPTLTNVIAFYTEPETHMGVSPVYQLYTSCVPGRRYSRSAVALGGEYGLGRTTSVIIKKGNICHTLQETSINITGRTRR